ncbi:MAG TPA: serine/threonine-protein kinase [Polyangiaceae bacterium]
MITGVRVGDVIAERYRVEAVLGAGAMGVVVAARHIELDDPVAIKFLAQDLVSSPHALGRFHREARAAAKIKHEHVIRVYDVGRSASGVPYLVMERLDGCDLATLLDREGPLPLAESLRYVREACAGIGEAHRLGIVHRDIKPSNLFCVRHADARRSVKVLDFGISKLIEPAPDGSITGTASLLGSPSYMSPEQMRAPNRVDHRTDIWSLGVVLYELSTGGLPFFGSSYAQLCLSVTSDTPDPPRARCPDLHPELEAIVLKCLHKNRDERYPSVAALAQALDAFVTERHGDAYKPTSTGSNTQAPMTLTAPVANWVGAPVPAQTPVTGRSTWARTVTPLVALGRSHQLALGVLAVAFVIGVALVGWSAARSESGAASAVRDPHPPQREHAPATAARAPAAAIPTAPPPVSANARPAPSPSSAVSAALSPAAPSSVSIRALKTVRPPSGRAPAPIASQPPPRAAKPPAPAIPVQRSSSRVWTTRE